MINQNKIAFINIGWEQLSTIEHVKKLGFKVYGIAFSKKIENKKLYEKILVTKFDNFNLIKRFIIQNQISNIISDQCDYSYSIHSKLITRLKLKKKFTKNINLYIKKNKQRNFCKKNKILVPNYYSTTNFDKAIRNIKKFNKEKLIIKPVDNRGGIGVKIFKKNQFSKKIFNFALKKSHLRKVILEEYIEGDHYNIDGLYYKNKYHLLGVSINKKMKNGFINESIYYDKKFLKDKKFINYFNKIVKKFNPRYGMLHIEVIIDKSNKIYLTEIANRGGGVKISNLVLKYVSGIDIDNYLVNINTNKLYNLKTIPEKKNVLIYFFQSKRSLNSLTLNEKNMNIIYFKLLNYNKKINNSADRNGVIICKGKNIKIIKKNIRKFIKK